MITRLDRYNNSWYKPGRSLPVRMIWYLINGMIFNSFLPGSGFRVMLLRMFGAGVGNGVVIKPNVSVKFPWKLRIGDHCWIGENVWIDNLAEVTIGSHVCISQGAMLLTGNHDFTKQTFDLIVKPIVIEDGVWLGAKSITSPGTVCRSHSVLTVSSVSKGELETYTIYRGNPAVEVKKRTISGA